MRSLRIAMTLIAVGALQAAAAAELMITEATALSFDRHPADGRIVLGMLDRLWLLPADGGTANELTPPGLRLERPRFSPDGSSIIAEGGWQDSRTHLWQIATDSGDAVRLMEGEWRDRSAAWHDDGQRLLFVSDRGGSDDIWEFDVASGTARQLTTLAGNETDPGYVNGGQQLIYVSDAGGSFRIMQQYYAGRAQALYHSARRLSAPTIRPGGVVISFLEQQADGSRVLNILLPVREMLTKTLIADGDLADHPVVWRDRNHYLVARNGKLEQRELAGRGRDPIEFTGWLSIRPATVNVAALASTEVGRRPQATPAPPFVLRATRILDVESGRHLAMQDVLIEDGRIAAIVPRRGWPERQVIDLGDATIMPGLIDITARYDAPPDAGFARLLLAAGITTIAGDAVAADTTPGWSTGPRVVRLENIADVRSIDDRRERLAALRRARETGTPAITDNLLPDLTFGPALLSASALPVSQPGRPVYADLRGLLDKSAVRIVSDTPEAAGWNDNDWQKLQRSRLYRQSMDSPAKPGAQADGRDRALPQSLVLTGELIAMQRSGASAASTLASATLRAAEMLGRPDLGRVKAGALADLLIVAGDPLNDIGALLDGIAVVSHGRLHSLAGLIETDPPD